MSAATELRDALLASSELVALVGGRIRADMALESDALPFVIFQRAGLIRHRGLDNSIHAQQETFQVECWGRTRSESVAVSEAAMDALEDADLPPDPSDPDGIDPDTLERAVVLNVDIWTNP